MTKIGVPGILFLNLRIQKAGARVSVLHGTGGTKEGIPAVPELVELSSSP